MSTHINSNDNKQTTSFNEIAKSAKHTQFHLAYYTRPYVVYLSTLCND